MHEHRDRRGPIDLHREGRQRRAQDPPAEGGIRSAAARRVPPWRRRRRAQERQRLHGARAVGRCAARSRRLVPRAERLRVVARAHPRLRVRADRRRCGGRERQRARRRARRGAEGVRRPVRRHPLLRRLGRLDLPHRRVDPAPGRQVPPACSR